MRGRKSPVSIHLTLQERLELEAILRRTTASAGLAHRARIILLLAEGHSITATARQVQDQRRIVRKWGQRYQQHRLQGLVDAPRSGRPSVFPLAVALHTVKNAVCSSYGCRWPCAWGLKSCRSAACSGGWTSGSGGRAWVGFCFVMVDAATILPKQSFFLRDAAQSGATVR